MPCHAKARGLGDQSYIQFPSEYHAFMRFSNAFESGYEKKRKAGTTDKEERKASQMLGILIKIWA